MFKTHFCSLKRTSAGVICGELDWDLGVDQCHLGSVLKALYGQGGERTREEEVAEEEFPSAIPLLPPLTKDTWDDYLKMYASSVGLLILFGGLVAPALELRMGVGGRCATVIMFELLPGRWSCLYPQMWRATNPSHTFVHAC